MPIAIDATVVREPLSGVHYAVRNQTLAVLECFAKHKPLILATDPLIRQAAEAAGCPCPKLPERLRKPGWRILWQQYRLPRLLKSHRCEQLLALAYTAPRKCPVPYVLQVHDTIALHRPELCSRLNAMQMKTFMPGSMQRAQQIITSSRQVAAEVAELSGHAAAEIHHVPLGVAGVFLGDESPPPLPAAWAALKPYLLFVGNLEPKKGLETLLAAYRQLDPACTLIFAGRQGWKCAKLIKEIDRYKGPGRMVRLGYVRRELLPTLYQQAAAAVLPSVVEGFGLPVLEALAMGTPVVHSDCPALVETAHGYGRPFPVGDAAALAAALAELLKAPEQARKETRPGRDWARTQTWRRWAETMAAATGLFQ